MQFFPTHVARSVLCVLGKPVQMAEQINQDAV